MKLVGTSSLAVHGSNNVFTWHPTGSIVLENVLKDLEPANRDFLKLGYYNAAGQRIDNAHHMSLHEIMRTTRTVLIKRQQEDGSLDTIWTWEMSYEPYCPNCQCADCRSIRNYRAVPAGVVPQGIPPAAVVPE